MAISLEVRLDTLPSNTIAPVGGYLKDKIPVVGTPSGAMLVGERVVFPLSICPKAIWVRVNLPGFNFGVTPFLTHSQMSIYLQNLF